MLRRSRPERYCGADLRWLVLRGAFSGGSAGEVAFMALVDQDSVMAASAHSSDERKNRRTAGVVSVVERSAAARVLSFLSSEAASDRSTVQIVDEGGRRLDVPAALRDVLYRAAELLAAGQSVAVLADEKMLSSQAAADVLNVSRQYLVRLVDAGELAAVKVGAHRRLRLADVEAFKAARDAKRAVALDQLTALSEEIGGYGFDAKRSAIAPALAPGTEPARPATAAFGTPETPRREEDSLVGGGATTLPEE